MNYVVIDVPLWSVTIWDKKFNGVDKEWQPKTIKYKYLLSDELDRINKGGTVRLLYTGQDIGYTSEEMAGDAICEGEIVSIPWGGTPSVKYYKGKFVTGDNRIATSSKPDELLNKYLFYYLKGHLRELASYYRGAGLKHPAMRDVLKMNISYPSATEQRNIIEQFDSLEKVIKVREAQLQKLDELIKARFVEMFGDPAINPKNWLVASLGEYITILTDFSSNGSYELLDSNVTMFDEPNYAVMVRTTDLENRNLQNYEGVKYINQKAYELLSKSKLFGGELIMNKIGSAGKIYLMPFISKPASLGRNAFMLRFDERINMTFLYTLLCSDYGTSEIQHYVRGAVTKTITKNDVKKVRIFVPPIELQNEFSNLVVQVDKSKVAVQKSLEQTTLLFDSLMQQYFG